MLISADRKIVETALADAPPDPTDQEELAEAGGHLAKGTGLIAQAAAEEDID